jgi:type III pantothenate kinase
MRFQAMHTFTAKLPLVKSKSAASLTGDNTESCMQSGVMNGVLAEVNGIVARYQEIYPQLGVILCGGDTILFENKLKQPIFVAPNLVLSGLNRILLHNVNF